jgi:hypothetical protein
MRLAPFALAPAVLATTLGVMVTRGGESDAAKKKAHDYWKQNLATWKDAPQPEIVDVDVKLKLDPAKSHFETSGRFTLSNPNDAPLKRFALTGGPHWSEVKWTMNGKEYAGELPLFSRSRRRRRWRPAARSRWGLRDLPKGKNGGGDGVHPRRGRVDSFVPARLQVIVVTTSRSASKERRTSTRPGSPDDSTSGRRRRHSGAAGVHRASRGRRPRGPRYNRSAFESTR